MRKSPLRSYNTDYKNFNLTRFFEKLQARLTNLDIKNLNFGSLKNCFIKLLDKVVPLKTKFLRVNQSKFVTKDVMLKTRLRNQFLKKRTLKAKMKENNQRNICVSLIKKAKQNYNKNLDLKPINDNKKLQ